MGLSHINCFKPLIMDIIILIYETIIGIRVIKMEIFFLPLTWATSTSFLSLTFFLPQIDQFYHHLIYFSVFSFLRRCGLFSRLNLFHHRNFCISRNFYRTNTIMPLKCYTDTSVTCHAMMTTKKLFCWLAE